MIALLCPTRGRPEQFLRLIESACKTAHNPDNIKVYSYIADNDAAKTMYVAQVLRLTGPDYATVHKWNILAEEALKNSDIKLFMLAADDMIFESPNWDRALINHYEALDNKVHVYALQDSRDENGTPHPIVTREYINAMGYFLPPVFLHWFCDSWTVKIAQYNKCFTHLKDYILIHDKPSDVGEADETHKRIRAFGWHDRDAWVDAHCRNTILTEEAQRLGALIRG